MCALGGSTPVKCICSQREMADWPLWLTSISYTLWITETPRICLQSESVCRAMCYACCFLCVYCVQWLHICFSRLVWITASPLCLHSTRGKCIDLFFFSVMSPFLNYEAQGEEAGFHEVVSTCSAPCSFLILDFLSFSPAFERTEKSDRTYGEERERDDDMVVRVKPRLLCKALRSSYMEHTL